MTSFARPRARRALLLATVLLAALVVQVARSRDDGGGGSAARSPAVARVVRVVDGDTILVSLDGRRERVRYIGVDTPESVKPDTPVQCYAERASTYNKRLLAGRSVRLVFDAEERDRYGRLLAYVYRQPDGLWVNAELARLGYARPLTIPPDTRYAGRFADLANEARRAGRGLWSACAR